MWTTDFPFTTSNSLVTSYYPSWVGLLNDSFKFSCTVFTHASSIIRHENTFPSLTLSFLINSILFLGNALHCRFRIPLSLLISVLDFSLFSDIFITLLRHLSRFVWFANISSYSWSLCSFSSLFSFLNEVNALVQIHLHYTVLFLYLVSLYKKFKDFLPNFFTTIISVTFYTILPRIFFRQLIDD